MKKLWFSVLFILVLCAYAWNFISTPPGEQKVSYSPANKECFNDDSGVGRFCIHKALQGTNGGIVYHMHGRNLSEDNWNDDTFYTAMIQAYWADHGKKPPIVVSVSYGPVWLLSPKGEAEKTGLLDTFILKTIPAVETRIGVPTYRALVGESMGALNSLIAGFHYPEMFQRIAAVCPAIYKISPFDSVSTIWNEVKSTGADPRTIFGILKLAKYYASTMSEWNAINPLALVKDLKPGYSTSLYMSSPLYDRYGLYAGGVEFISLAKERGLNIQWRPIYGGHCAVDVQSIAEFLL